MSTILSNLCNDLCFRADVGKYKSEIKESQKKANQEKIVAINEDTQSYLKFVEFTYDMLLTESEELPKLIGNLQQRILKTTNPNNIGALHALNKIPKDPDFDALKLEFFNQPSLIPVSFDDYFYYIGS